MYINNLQYQMGLQGNITYSVSTPRVQRNTMLDLILDRGHVLLVRFVNVQYNQSV